MLENNKIVDEYDPSVPNDYEELLLARERKTKRDAEDRQRKRDREQRDAEERERRQSMAPPSFSSSSKSGSMNPARAAMIGKSGGMNPARAAMIAASSGGHGGFSMPPPSGGFAAPPPKKSKMAPVPSFNKVPDQKPYVARAESSFNTTSPTRVVLLRNMVGRGQVDADLESEVAEECQKYGRVSRCIAYEVPGRHVPDHDAVRIFVQFGSIKAAITAVEGLNGRFFAGRTVKACYYSELKLTLKDFMQ